MRKWFLLVMAIVVFATLVFPMVAFAATGDPPGIAAVLPAISAVVWAATGVLKRISVLKDVDTQIIAVGVTVVCGVVAYYLGYLQGDPLVVVTQLVTAMFGANLFHDKLTAPITTLFAGEVIQQQ